MKIMGAHRTTLLIVIIVIFASCAAYLASATAAKWADPIDDVTIPIQNADTMTLAAADKAPDVLAANSPDPSVQAGFIPHKALYEIKLSGKKSGAQILNVHGHMLYDWNSNCEAWNSSHKFTLVYEYADAPPMQVSSDYSLYELFDGSSLNYSSQRKSEGELIEELRGSALINEEGGQAVNRMPEGVSFDLPAGTLFPMRHSLEVFKNMRAGKKFFNAVIFDGSDQEGPISVNAFMGAPRNAPESLKSIKAIDQSLLDSQAHFIRLAFFPLKSETSEADYEMSMTLHDNGVISDMEIDYEDFSVVQRLVALEKTTTDCSGNLNVPAE